MAIVNTLTCTLIKKRSYIQYVWTIILAYIAVNITPHVVLVLSPAGSYSILHWEKGLENKAIAILTLHAASLLDNALIV